jgi:signal peptide peptidase SppA
MSSLSRGERIAALSELRQSPWAVRQEMADTLAGLVSRGEVPAIEIPATEAVTEAAAALRSRGLEQHGDLAVIPLRGLITPRGSFLSMLFGGGGGLQSFKTALREALANDDVSGILLDIDSPGGSTDLVTETAAEIRAAREKKPVTAIANTDAGSAAYALASQATELVVTPSGEVGSIGVFMLHWDESGFNERIGINPTYIYEGRYKIEGNPDEPLSDEAREAFQSVCREFYEIFVADVAAGRGVSEGIVREKFGEGRMVTATSAVAAGMADRVETYEDLVARLTGRPPERPRARQQKNQRTETRALLLARERH